jgi:hypothetical protein
MGGKASQDNLLKKKDKTSASVAEAALAKIKKNEDKTFSLTEDEFCSIGWYKDWPLIISDLAFYMTNQNLLKGTKISEYAELN